MSGISTHVLDTSGGKPATGVRVLLERQVPNGWHSAGQGITDDNGRIPRLLPGDGQLEAGVYRLVFHPGAYSQFYPEIAVQFRVEDPTMNYHIPILLSPYGYTTYRGS